MRSTAPPPRVLSAGCGIGLDVDLLTDHGFEDGPREPFLLSLSDHRRLFLDEGCRRLEIGPLADYFYLRSEVPAPVASVFCDT